ncbi:MAG: extracellular solute-binding protein [Ancalomicrobiaceae bacterium]|nr:extracellular solute-binding protein [Ancalomicrobiaceae bacterium]
MIELRGLAWDHRRCWGPLDASVAPYCAAHPDLRIAWDRRSLYEFGEGALADVLADYDLIIFDHPFIGDIAASQLLAPFDASLGADRLAEFARDSVGKSWSSYSRNGSQWALPIDAACQVASYRPDLMAGYGPAPTDHAALLRLARRLRADDKWIGLPMVPTDAMCLLLTFAAQKTGNAPYGFADRAVVETSLGELQELARLAHPLSRQWNPIRCYDHMVANDDVVYVPYAFGYVNYASAEHGPHLVYCDIPAAGHAGALLGGAGIGVSSQSKYREAAMAYAIHLSLPAYQRQQYVDAGGQPGSLAAWQDERVNAVTRNFFRDTLATIQASYLRPLDPGFIDFFRAAAPLATHAILGEMSAKEFFQRLTHLSEAGLARSAREGAHHEG